MSYIRPLTTLGRADIGIAGGKGANLGELTRAGFPVPPGFVVSTAAYSDYVRANDLHERILQLCDAAGTGPEAALALFSEELPEGLRAEVVTAFVALGRPAVAVRSSATAEDLAEASFAGQQDSFLNVRGEDELSTAVRRCWASLWNERAIDYRARRSVDPSTVSLAVVVQEMVDAEAAGVLFTANPANGRREQAVIAAAWGLGEAVVSGAVNTDDLVVDKETGAVLSRTTGDKAVLTTYAGTGTVDMPVPPDRRREPVLDDAAAAELARLGSEIEAHFGAPQDIEWARAGGSFWIVQSRPITALPAPEAEPPSEWPVADGTAMYVRASIIEQLPDPLTPLFAELIDSSVTRSLQALFDELAGEHVVRREDVNMPTINGYAFYRYSRAGMLRLTLRSGGAFRLLLGGEDQGARVRWRSYSHPRYQEAVAGWAHRDLRGLTAAELLDGVSELLDAGTAYYTSVQTIIPLAVTSEVVFTKFYDALVRRPGDAPATTFLLGFDSLPIRSEQSLFDLADWVRAQPDLVRELVDTPTERLVALVTGVESQPAAPAWGEWRSRFQAHLDRFGHLVYNLDFANAVPADDPGPLIDTLRFYLQGHGTDPSHRQQASTERRERETRVVLERLDPVRARVFARLLRWAQQVAPIREDALGDVGLAWPQMRRMLAELGVRLGTAGVLHDSADVYWLQRDELLAAAEAADPTATAGDLAQLIGDRQKLWRGQRRVTPPQVLPAYWARIFGSMLPATDVNQSGDVVNGIGASSGRVTARARVLDGPQDFGEMRPGDVLVASITTPAWTPLFAMAAGIVTDIGGPLSHSSIVAREYGIPAVLGTGVATRRISSGQLVTVDGDRGRVLLTAADPDDLVDDRPSRRPARRAVAGVAVGVFLAAFVRAVRRRRS